MVKTFWRFFDVLLYVSQHTRPDTRTHIYTTPRHIYRDVVAGEQYCFYSLVDEIFDSFMWQFCDRMLTAWMSFLCFRDVVGKHRSCSHVRRCFAFFPARVAHFISENSGDFFFLVVGRILVQNTSATMGGVKLLRRIPAESLSPEQRTTTWEMNYPWSSVINFRNTFDTYAGGAGTGVYARKKV